MRKNILYLGTVLGLAILFLYTGCKKDRGYYSYKNELHQFSGNTYDFLKSQVGVYDSFLYVVDRAQLTDSLKTGSYTVFAPTNASFQQAITDMNNLRKIQGRPLEYLATIPLEQLDTMVCRYIIRGKIPADSMNQQDGVDIYAVRYGYTMHGKLVNTNAEGYVKGGPAVIQFSDTKGVVYTRQWSTSTTVAVDIKTTTGLVNVLERNHEFGFNEFISRVNPTFSQPFLGIPFPIPGTIGLEQYDKGGERVAYHDNDPSNNGGQYRPSEGVDIENAGGGEYGYDVGWTASNEWMNYTVNINDTGAYKLIVRAASPYNDGRLHFELDGVRITPAIEVPGTGGWQNYGDLVAITSPLPKGKHILKIYYDYANFNLRFLKFLPLNRPYPIPGTIPCEEFDQGGEGVAYHDLDASNNGGKYRTHEGVDIEDNRVGGGYDIGWTNGGEWLNYTIDVKATGLYNLAVTVGSPNNPNGGNRFHVEIDGTDMTGAMTCPNTHGWQNWTNIKTSVYLQKGVHVMKFFEETGGYNIRSYTFSAIN